MRFPGPRAAGLAAALWCGLAWGGDEAVEKAVAQAHGEVWRRFIDLHEVMLDYTALDGSYIRPTPEECRAHKPNALSWGVPIEDGPMLNGLYLDALCTRWRVTGEEEVRVKARRLVRGLLFLSSVGSTPGFIARGVATDGVTAFPMGSNDQTTPWLYGLWRFTRDGLAEPEERARLVAAFTQQVGELERTEWRMPCEGGPSPFRGDFKRPTWESAPRLLFVMKAMHGFTGDGRWQQRYLSALAEKVGKGQRTRLEICATGMVFDPGQGPRHSWTGSEGVACLRALWEMETEPGLRAAYARGLLASAQLAAQSLPLCGWFDSLGGERFEQDWRVMNAAWRPQGSEAEAVAVAEAGLKVQHRASPRMGLEKEFVREPCFAAWVVALCPDRAFVAQQRAAICDVIAHYRYDRLYLSQFFPVESAWWRLKALEAEAPATTGEPFAITTFDTPFTFSYLSWQDKIQVADGRAVLRGLACNGGAGVNTQMNLSACAGLTPAFRLRTTAANTAKTLQLQLLDADDMSGSWQFALPPPSADFVTVTPKGAAAVSTPNALHRDQKPVAGKLDLARIVQYQVQGDWQKGAVDLELDAIVLLTPDASMLAERERYAKQAAQEAALQAKQAEEAQARAACGREQKLRAYAHRTARSPEVTHVSLVGPDVLSLTIEAQRTVLSTMSKYEPQPGDEKKEQKWRDGVVRQASLIRNGKRIGRLQGKDLDWLFTDERLEGDPLLEFTTEEAANYTIRSADDPAYAAGVKPLAVYRKSVPSDVVLPGGQHPTRHRIYLKLPSKVEAGKRYAIKVDAVNVKNGDLTFAADLQNVRSEAVHVNQIGYRPDDPVKRAFLSVWLGTGGAYTFPEGLRFTLADGATGQAVFSGKVERVMAADGTETLCAKPPKNYSGTAVYRMDFSAVTAPGTYRVCVEGVGCSYPFEIGPSVWQKAFLVQMKGLYNQRSGVELGPPYSDFRKPRDFHADDGAVITRSTYDVLFKGPSAYDEMPKGDTGEAVTNAWGGYHDAGDWNPRRVTHMYTTLAQLELCELHPGFFNTLKLNIPQAEGIPDMVVEALFEIDCFRRLQLPDGAIPYGIETDGDPLAGEVSWLSTQHAYVLAPNIRDSWLYAATAARASKVLTPLKPELAKTYEASAVRAFRWAEAEYAKRQADGSLKKVDELWEAVSARNLAAINLYDLSGDKAYHDVFLQDTGLTDPDAELCAWGYRIQCDAAFHYALLDPKKADPVIRKNAVAAVRKLADRSLEYAAANAFNLTQREQGRPMFAGFFSTSGGSELVRAHHLTGKPEYLLGAVQSCQFQAGCNPNNLVYTTGLGANPVRVPLELDARSSGQAVPVGLTVFGNSDYFSWPHSFWDINLQFVNRPEFIWPDAYAWPLTEAYFETWVLVSANEYVIDTWAPNVLVWGYLAARP